MTDGVDPSVGHALGAWPSSALSDTETTYVFFVNGNGTGRGMCDIEVRVKVDPTGDPMVGCNSAFTREVMDARDEEEGRPYSCSFLSSQWFLRVLVLTLL